MQNPSLFDDLLEDAQSDFGDVLPDESGADASELPPRRVSPGAEARREAVQQGLQKRGGSRLNRYAGSLIQTIWEGARAFRPVGVRGLSRQDKGVAGLGAQFFGEQESLVNIRSTDGRKLSYAEGTPEFELQRRMQEVQGRGEDIYAFLESDEMKRYLARHKLKPLRFGVDIGALSLFPGLADTSGTFGESVGLALNKLFGTQLFGNAENARQMWEDIGETFEVWTPEGRSRFVKALDDDPGQVLADGAMLLMLKGKAAGGVGRGAVMAGNLAKANARRNLVRSGVKLQRLNQVLNEGFSVPGIERRPLLANRRGFLFERDAVGRLRSRMGVSELVDPEEWGARSAVELPQMAASKALSPFEGQFEQSYREALQDLGLDPLRLPATLMSRSQVVATRDAKREAEDDVRIVEGLETAVVGIESRVDEILADAHVSGDIAEAGRAISAAFESFVGQVRAEAQRGYDRETPERKDFIMSLRNVWRALYGEGGIVAESKALEESVGFSDFDQNPILRGFDETMERIQQSGEAGITPEFVEGTEVETRPLQGGERKQADIDLGTVQDANRQGSARRMAFSPTWQTSAVEYDVAPLESLVASHLLTGERNPVFDALAEVLGAGELQTRDYNDRKVRGIASNLRPEAYLLDLMATDRGAPIAVPVEVTEDMAGSHEVLAPFVGETLHLVLAGNNRVEALEMARREYPTDFQLYQEELPKILPDYGFDMTHGEAFDAPVLFRRLLDDVNLQEFASDSNVDTARRHTTGEQAVKDSLVLDSELLGRLNLNLQGRLEDVLQDASNIGEQGAVRDWLRRIEAEAGDMYVETTDPTDGSSRTELTQAGVRRLRNALFRRTFSSPQGLKMLELFETVQNSGIANIQRGVEGALLAVARVEFGALREDGISEQYKIADAVAEAVVGAWQMARTGAQEGRSIAESIRHYANLQGELPGVTALVSGVARDVLDVLERAVSEPKVLSGFLTDYGDTVAAQAPDTEMSRMMGVELPSQESLIYQLKDRWLGDGALDNVVSEMAQRVGMEHMTLNEQTYRQILADGEIRGDTIEAWRGQSRPVWVSMGPYYRRGAGHKWGFIFSTNALERRGITPYPTLIGEPRRAFDRWLDEKGITEEQVDGDYERYLRQFMQETEYSLEEHHRLSTKSAGHSEFTVDAPLPLSDAVAVVEGDVVKVITESTRGKDPSQWEFREPTSADMEPSAVAVFFERGEDVSGWKGLPQFAVMVSNAMEEAYPAFRDYLNAHWARYMESDSDRSARRDMVFTLIQEFIDQEGLSVADVVDRLSSSSLLERLAEEKPQGILSEDAPRDSATERAFGRTIIQGFDLGSTINQSELGRAIRDFMLGRLHDADAIKIAEQWSDAERETFIRVLVDSQYYQKDWMNRMDEAFDRNPALAKAQFGAESPEAAIEKWESFVTDNFIDVWDAEKKADLVRIQLSERSKPFNVKGREVSGHREIAVISQALRDAGREFMTVFYVQETREGQYRVRGHETTTLNAPGVTSAAVMSEIEARRAGYGDGTKVVFLHNHPSAAASFSDGDISTDNMYRGRFGDNYLGFLVIDSGEYAMSWRRESTGGPVYERRTHIQLEERELGWNPQWPRRTTIQGFEAVEVDRGAEMGSPHIRAEDPLFKSTGYDGPDAVDGEHPLDFWGSEPVQNFDRTIGTWGNKTSSVKMRHNIIQFGKTMQVDHNWTVFAMQGSWGRLNALVQVKDFHRIPRAARADFLRNLSLDYGGSRIYVYVGKGDWYRTMGDAVKVFTDINEDQRGGGVMSVMVSGYTRGWLNPAEGFQERMWKPDYPMERTGYAYDAPRRDRLAMEHMTMGRDMFNDILKSGGLAGSRNIEGHPMVYFSRGPYFRNNMRHDYGFIYSTTDLMNAGAILTPEFAMDFPPFQLFLNENAEKYRDLPDWNDRWSADTYARVMRDFMEEEGLNAEEWAQEQLEWSIEGLGFDTPSDAFREFGIMGDAPFSKIAPVGIVEKGVVKMITESTRGADPSKWEYREATEADLEDAATAIEGSRIRGIMSYDTGPPDRPQARRADVDLTAQRTPYTYGSAEAFSTALRRKIEALERSDTSNPQELRWYKKLRAALEADMDESLRAHRPDLADKIDQVDLAYAVGMTKVNSAYAKHILKNVGSDLVEGTDAYRKMVSGLFSPGMDVASVGLVYELVGGFDSEAGRRMRRVFLEQLFSDAVTPRARTERAKQRRGQSKRLRAWQRVSPGGLGTALGKWQRNTGQYPSELLEAILGKPTVDALYDLDSVSLQFARVVQKLGGSQTAPWMQEFLRSDYRTERLWHVLQTMGSAFGFGAVGGGVGYAAGAGAMSLGFGAVTFLTAWLGSGAVGKLMEFLQDKPIGKRYLLEGTVVSMGHVLTGDPVFASPEVAAESRAKQRAGRGVARPSTLRAIRRLGRRRRDDEDEEVQE